MDRKFFWAMLIVGGSSVLILVFTQAFVPGIAGGLVTQTSILMAIMTFLVAVFALGNWRRQIRLDKMITVGINAAETAWKVFDKILEFHTSASIADLVVASARYSHLCLVAADKGENFSLLNPQVGEEVKILEEMMFEDNYAHLTSITNDLNSLHIQMRMRRRLAEVMLPKELVSIYQEAEKAAHGFWATSNGIKAMIDTWKLNGPKSRFSPAYVKSRAEELYRENIFDEFDPSWGHIRMNPQFSPVVLRLALRKDSPLHNRFATLESALISELSKLDS